MKFLRTIILCLVLSTAFVSVHAQQMKKVAQTGFQFLKIEPDPRGAAMAGAFVAVADNANSLFWNPAGMSQVSSFDITFNNTQWFADINQFAGAAVYALTGADYVGLSINSVNYGEIVTTIPSANEIGYEEPSTFTPGGLAVGIGYARQFTDIFAIGAQVKFASENLGSSMVQRPGDQVAHEVDNQVSGIGFDIGTLYYTGFKDLRISMAIRNFSTELEYENEGFQMPLIFDLGLAMDVFTLTELNESHSLTLAVDAIHPRDYTERMHVGAEYAFMNTFFVRTGYKVNYDEAGISGGFGVNSDVAGFNFRLDYAFSSMGEFLGNVHRISLGTSL